MQISSSQNISLSIAKKILLGFERHYKNIKSASIEAKRCFEVRDWEKIERDSKLRLNFYDEQVDDLTNKCMEEVISLIKSNMENIEYGSHLLFVTKNIERIGDHTTNIAEQVFYLVTGDYLEGERPKGSDSELTK